MFSKANPFFRVCLVFWCYTKNMKNNKGAFVYGEKNTQKDYCGI